MGSSVNPGNYGDCYDGTNYAGAEQYWRFRHDGAARVEVTIASTRGTTTRDLDLFVLDAGDGSTACSADTLSCLDGSRLSGGDETVAFAADPGALAYVVYDLWASPTTETAEYTLAVTCTPIVCGDGNVSAGEGCDDGGTTPGDGCSDTCTVEATHTCDDSEPSVCTPLAPNALCANATAITANTALTGENIDIGGPRPPGTGCGGGTGNSVLYYSVNLPPSTRVDVIADSTADLVLFTQDACADAGCTYSTDFPESLTLSNTGTASVTRIVGVRGYSTSTTGTVDIDFTYTTLAANGTCAGATPLGAGVTGHDVAIGGSRPTGTGCSAGTGPVRYYSVTIPPNSATTVTGTPSATWDLTLRSLADCSGTCLATRDSAGDGGAESLTLTNMSASEVTQLIAVGAWDADTGTFNLTSTNTPFAANATCAAAAALGAGVTGVNLATGGPRPTGTNCGGSLGPVLYYSVTIPANSITTVTGTSTGTPSWDLTLRSLADCSGACLSNVDASSSAAESLRFSNATASPITRLVAVGADSSSTFGTFDLSSTTTALAANSTCGGARAITANASFTGESFALGGPRPQGTDCGTSSGDNALYYAVTIPPMTTVAVATTSTTDRVLLAQDSCGATACAFRTDTSPESWGYSNTTASAVTKYLAVHNASTSGSGGTFDIAFAYTPLTYALATVAGACVDASAGTVVSDATGDDDASAINALPFTLSFFGDAMTHWSVNTNGLMQLYTSATGTASNQWANRAIPSTETPNGLIAAFWDDLEDTSTSSIRTLTTGTTGSQVFVVEWNNVLVRAVSSSTVRFQAHLHEGTNVIELHYCAASGTDAALTGSGATVGIESASGLTGLNVSSNAAGATAVGTAYRFTPN
jgi:cysteine-rich repeat protein